MFENTASTKSGLRGRPTTFKCKRKGVGREAGGGGDWRESGGGKILDRKGGWDNELRKWVVSRKKR